MNTVGIIVLPTGRRVYYKDLRFLIFKETYDHAFWFYFVSVEHTPLFWIRFDHFSCVELYGENANLKNGFLKTSCNSLSSFRVILERQIPPGLYQLPSVHYVVDFERPFNSSRTFPKRMVRSRIFFGPNSLISTYN